jgi:hypothetical protein
MAITIGSQGNNAIATGRLVYVGTAASGLMADCPEWLYGTSGGLQLWVSGLGTIGARGNRLIALVLRWGERCVVAALVCTGGVSGILIGNRSFADYPYSGDEWSNVLQAESFSQGRLHANPPAQPQCFDVSGMVSNGKFHAWVSPSRPFLLASRILPLMSPFALQPNVWPGHTWAKRSKAPHSMAAHS